MGGRFWIGIFLLICLLIAGCLVSTSLTTNQEQLALLIENAERLAHDQNMMPAEQAVQAVYDLWQQHLHLLASIADHEPLDEVESTFQQLFAFAKEKDTENFLAGCARLTAGVRAIVQAHEPVWWNIL